MSTTSKNAESPRKRRGSRFAVKNEERDEELTELLSSFEVPAAVGRDSEQATEGGSPEAAGMGADLPAGGSVGVSGSRTPGVAVESSEAAVGDVAGRTSVAPRRRPGTKTTNVRVPVVLARRVRAHRARVKLSYLQLVLEAIEKNAAELSQKWTEPESGAGQSGSELFPGLTAAIKESEESSAVVAMEQITLSGMSEQYDEQLRRLQTQWHAPSRQELVTAALELQYPERRRRR